MASAVLAMILAGCSGASPALPAIGGSPVSQAPTDPEAVAAAMYSCLAAAGLPVEHAATPNGRLALITFAADAHVIWKTPHADLQFTSALTEEQMQEQVLAVTNQGADIPDDTDNMVILIVEGQDRSSIMSRCVEQSGYDETVVFNANNPDLVEVAWDKLRLIATNEWAQCARENGYPTVKDATMPDDSVNADPIALLPATITEAELRRLLTACPSFFPDVERDNARIWQEVADNKLDANPLPDGLKGQPNVGFDYPGFRGDPTESDVPTGPDADATVARLARLVGVLNEPVDAYVNSGGG